jgi:drug/metabolite transporter (DMT)-like permease
MAANLDKYKLSIILSGILLGPIGVIVKLIGNAVPVTSLIFWRLLFATIFAFIILAPKHLHDIITPTKKELGHNALTGLFMMSAFTLYMAALVYAPVANVALITSTYIIIVPILAFFLLKEKTSTHLPLAILIALTGILIMNPFTTGFLFGNSIAFVQAIVFALMVVYFRMEEKHHDIGAVFWFFAFATLFSVPLLLVKGVGDVKSVLDLIILLGIISTTLPYILLSYGLEKTDAGTGSVLTLVTFPLSSILLAFLIISEVVSLRTYLGGTLLIVAGLVTLWKWKHKRHFLAH